MTENLIILTSLVTAVATCGLVAVAATQLRAIQRSAKDARRPYLFAQVHKDKTREGKEGIYLSITNYGQSGATRIILAVSAEPWKAVGNRRFAFESPPGIAFLPPGATLSYFLGPATGDLLQSFIAPQGVSIEGSYDSPTTQIHYQEGFLVSLLDSYGAKSTPPRNLADGY
jgi:hypothetical protein